MSTFYYNLRSSLFFCFDSKCFHLIYSILCFWSHQSSFYSILVSGSWFPREKPVNCNFLGKTCLLSEFVSQWKESSPYNFDWQFAFILFVCNLLHFGWRIKKDFFSWAQTKICLFSIWPMKTIVGTVWFQIRTDFVIILFGCQFVFVNRTIVVIIALERINWLGIVCVLSGKWCILYTSTYSTKYQRPKSTSYSGDIYRR